MSGDQWSRKNVSRLKAGTEVERRVPPVVGLRLADVRDGSFLRDPTGDSFTDGYANFFDLELGRDVSAERLRSSVVQKQTRPFAAERFADAGGDCLQNAVEIVERR